MYFLGVDGGTTKTLAIIADGQGRIQGAARGPGSNWTGEDVTIPMAVVVETVRQALQKVGMSGEEIALGVFSLAGADWPEDHTRRAAALNAAGIARRVIVKNDSFGGLRAGTTRPYGIVLAVGTGINAAAIAPDGREWAFGYYVTYGGAGTIATEAIDAVMRAESGVGSPTRLTRDVLDLLGFESVENLLKALVAKKVEYRDQLRVCPLVFEAAAKNDPTAAAIIIKQAKALAEYATALARRFDMQALEFDVVLAGSVFKGSGPLLVDTLTEEIRGVAPNAQIVRARFEPVVGSLLLAYDAASVPVTEAVYKNLAASAPGAEFFDTKNSTGYNPIRHQEEE